MNKYQIIWSPKARDDINEIFIYISFNLKESIIAKNIINKIINSVYSLDYLPERHSRICNFKSTSKVTRKLIIDNFIVLYEVDNNTRTGLYSTYISW